MPSGRRKAGFLSARAADGSPLVSAVIPTFNRWPLVNEAQESALKQPADDLEVIVIDDGSTDGTQEALPAEFPTVRVLHQANAERGVARNRGAREAVHVPPSGVEVGSIHH